MNPFQRRDNPHALMVGMTGVKMGDRLLQVGCEHGGRLAAVAGKVGLSGRALAVVADEASAERARKGAIQGGVLIDVTVAPPTALGVGEGEFDLAVVDDTAGAISGLAAHQQKPAIGQVLHALRPGGRMIFVQTGTLTGLRALLSGRSPRADFDAPAMMQAEGFRSVRELADREGLRFIEGIKPR